ncbi:hypothetical protein J2Z40_000956 [Cytobacillus eiseniae]|uniref:YtkA-like domain-containing protein n=1 Tax=Cytobacillus eiseniae TaxID=762947 RepID=A0ABS4RDC6_9BACI|nr:FixH family protein [Cytobacillus eiseniae]MBP2240401.1 hypothetical protein [Cytobacillus eiseniae]
MQKFMVSIFAVLLMLAGCSDKEIEKDTSKEEVPQILEAAIEIPETGELDEEIMLSVHVTQGEEPVEDASEVKFEIWKDGLKDQSEMVEASHTENGQYSVGHSFKENGKYHVQSHVTARNMHTMPTESIQIGEVEEDAHHSDNQTNEESHHHGDVTIHLEKPDAIQSNEQIPLSVHLQKGEEPLNKARVRLEISQNGSTPVWVELEEKNEGEYLGDYSFPSSGTFLVKIHVNNDEGLHEHSEVELDIQ